MPEVPIETFVRLLREQHAILLANHDPSSCISRASLKHELDTALFNAQNAYTEHLGRLLDVQLKKEQP